MKEIVFPLMSHAALAMMGAPLEGTDTQREYRKPPRTKKEKKRRKKNKMARKTRQKQRRKK